MQMPKTPVSILLPLPSTVKTTSSWDDPGCYGGTFVNANSTRRRAQCPLCSQPSRHVHSHYSRSPVDLPCIGRPIGWC